MPSITWPGGPQNHAFCATPSRSDGIFAGAPMGLAVFDPDLRIRRVNDAYAAITGLPAADHAGLRQLTGKVQAGNLGMRALYRKFGFEAAHLTMERRAPGQDPG